MITANDSVLEAKSINECPKCHFRNIAFPRAGKTAKGRQMYRCPACQKRFIEERGTLSFYSQLGKEQWIGFLASLEDDVTRKEAAKTIHVDVSTIYRMKKKYERYMAEM